MCAKDDVVNLHQGQPTIQPGPPDSDHQKKIAFDRANVLTQTKNQILTEGFKGLILINGGGAVALAAFLQATWDKPSATALHIYLLVGIGLLLFGTALAASIFVTRYMSFYHPKTHTPLLNPWWWSTMTLIALSLVCFLMGMATVVVGGLYTVNHEPPRLNIISPPF